jgi:hypothetical protein
MTLTRYPTIDLGLTLAVLLAAEPGSLLTPATLDKALAGRPEFTLTADSFETVRADLDRAHMIDDEGRLTPLADKFAAMWRRFLAKEPRG